MRQRTAGPNPRILCTVLLEYFAGEKPLFVNEPNQQKN